MIRNAPVDSDTRLRGLRRAAVLWLGGGLLLLALGPWPAWSPTDGWSLVFALLLAPLAVLAWLLAPADADADAAVSQRCRDGGVRGGAGSPA